MPSINLINGGTATNHKIDNLTGTGLKGIISVTKGDTNVTVQGSLDGENYQVIKTFSASAVEEIVLCPRMRVNGAADATNDDSIGSSTATIYFHNSAFTS